MRRASCGGWKERTKRRNHARPLQWVATDTQSIKPTSAAPVGNPGLFTGRYYSIVAIPRTPPGWMGDIQTHVHPTPGTPYSRLRWENINLPIIARQLGIRVLHQTTSTAPLLSDSVTLLSPCSFGADIGDWLSVEHLSGDTLANGFVGQGSIWFTFPPHL